MKALLFLIGIFLYVLFQSNGRERLVSFLAILMNLFWLLIYELDLLRINREVYWSDAEYYISGKVEGVTSFPGYDWLIQDLVDFGCSPFMLRVMMTLIVGIVHLLLFRLTELKSVNKWFVLLILCNPFFSLSLVRLMKDAYFLLLLCLILDINRKGNLLGNVVLLLGFFILPSVRPWSVVLPLLFLLRSTIAPGTFKKRLFTGMFVICILTLTLMKYKYFLVWIDYITSGKIGTFDLGLTNQIKGLARIFFSPGIYRILNPDIYFMYWLPSLLFSIGSGLLLNYYVIAAFSVKRFVLAVRKNRNSSMLLLYILTGIFVYTFAYSGSVEFRIKASLILPLFYILASAKVWKTKNLSFTLFKYFIIIFIFSSYGF